MKILYFLVLDGTTTVRFSNAAFPLGLISGCFYKVAGAGVFLWSRSRFFCPAPATGDIPVLRIKITKNSSDAEPEPVEPKLFGKLEPEPKINLNKHFLQSVWRMLGRRKANLYLY